jgi:hypothetical protein
MQRILGRAFAPLALFCVVTALAAAPVDLSHAVVVSRPGMLPDAEHTASLVLIEEIQKRTGIRLRNRQAGRRLKPR